MFTRIQKEDFDVNEEIKLCTGGDTGVGGVATFLGIVRDNAQGKRIKKIDLSSYEGMAEKQLKKLRQSAMERFDVMNVTIVHRIGTLEPSDNIVCIVATAGHRTEAFNACEFTIDELKKTVPIWKKEFTQDGDSWVESL